jgi:hypothetical protein
MRQRYMGIEPTRRFYSRRAHHAPRKRCMGAAPHQAGAARIGPTGKGLVPS